jgi:hypothetical protein
MEVRQAVDAVVLAMKSMVSPKAPDVSVTASFVSRLATSVSKAQAAEDPWGLRMEAEGMRWARDVPAAAPDCSGPIDHLRQAWQAMPICARVVIGAAGILIISGAIAYVRHKWIEWRDSPPAAALALAPRLGKIELLENQVPSVECVVCMDRVRTRVFPKCGHAILCDTCADALKYASFSFRPITDQNTKIPSVLIFFPLEIGARYADPDVVNPSAFSCAEHTKKHFCALPCNSDISFVNKWIVKLTLMTSRTDVRLGGRRRGVTPPRQGGPAGGRRCLLT